MPNKYRIKKFIRRVLRTILVWSALAILSGVCLAADSGSSDTYVGSDVDCIIDRVSAVYPDVDINELEGYINIAYENNCHAFFYSDDANYIFFMPDDFYYIEYRTWRSHLLVWSYSYFDCYFQLGFGNGQLDFCRYNLTNVNYNSDGYYLGLIYSGGYYFDEGRYYTSEVICGNLIAYNQFAVSGRSWSNVHSNVRFYYYYYSTSGPSYTWLRRNIINLKSTNDIRLEKLNQVDGDTSYPSVILQGLYLGSGYKTMIITYNLVGVNQFGGIREYTYSVSNSNMATPSKSGEWLGTTGGTNWLHYIVTENNLLSGATNCVNVYIDSVTVVFSGHESEDTLYLYNDSDYYILLGDSSLILDTEIDVDDSYNKDDTDSIINGVVNPDDVIISVIGKYTDYVSSGGWFTVSEYNPNYPQWSDCYVHPFTLMSENDANFNDTVDLIENVLNTVRDVYTGNVGGSIVNSLRVLGNLGDLDELDVTIESEIQKVVGAYGTVYDVIVLTDGEYVYEFYTERFFTRLTYFNISDGFNGLYDVEMYSYDLAYDTLSYLKTRLDSMETNNVLFYGNMTALAKSDNDFIRKIYSGITSVDSSVKALDKSVTDKVYSAILDCGNKLNDIEINTSSINSVLTANFETLISILNEMNIENDIEPTWITNLIDLVSQLLALITAINDTGLDVNVTNDFTIGGGGSSGNEIDTPQELGFNLYELLGIGINEEVYAETYDNTTDTVESTFVYSVAGDIFNGLQPWFVKYIKVLWDGSEGALDDINSMLDYFDSDTQNEYLFDFFNPTLDLYDYDGGAFTPGIVPSVTPTVTPTEVIE